ncbi:hypothetical protein [Nocardia neocaledoniensis]|uniref:hypothetical protein n=1 Tax=Nocardia neocaledoniensis TaxID=236511 RepID=UPI002458B040|nr:hypothetical protein [Nocardia neocaledoniensis]
MADDNPFSAYFTAPETAAAAEVEKPQRKRPRRRREAEPQTIGTTPETWPPPEPEVYDEEAEEFEPDYPAAYTPPEHDDPSGDDGAVDDGYTGDWNDWNTELPADAAAQARSGDEVDWDDWATTTAAEQSRDYVPTPTLPRLTDYGGGGKIARRPRRDYDDERYDGDRGKTRVVAAIGGIIGAAALVAVAGGVATVFGDDSTPAPSGGAGAPAASATTSTTAPLPAHGLSGCETFRSQTITISAERGDTATPQGAILGFEYSYFVDRSAVKARSFVTDDAHVGNEAALATGIAGLPQDVRYCVHITRGDANDTSVWDVTVRQQWPGDPAPEKIAYVIRTTEVSDGRHKITSINYK